MLRLGPKEKVGGKISILVKLEVAFSKISLPALSFTIYHQVQLPVLRDLLKYRSWDRLYVYLKIGWYVVFTSIIVGLYVWGKKPYQILSFPDPLPQLDWSENILSSIILDELDHELEEGVIVICSSEGEVASTVKERFCPKLQLLALSHAHIWKLCTPSDKGGRVKFPDVEEQILALIENTSNPSTKTIHWLNPLSEGLSYEIRLDHWISGVLVVNYE